MKLLEKSIAAVFAVTIATTIVFTTISSADEELLTWIGSADKITSTVDDDIGYAKMCRQQTISVIVASSNQTSSELKTADACVFESPGFSVAGLYSIEGSFRQNAAVKLGNAEHFIPIDMQSISLAYSSLADVIVYRNATDARELHLIRNASTNLVPGRRDSSDRLISYEVKADASQQQFQHASPYEGAYHQAHSYAISPNGKYIASYIDYRGIVLLSLETGDSRVIKLDNSSEYSPYKPYVSAVSNDGRYVAGGPNISIIDTTNCGLTLAEFERDMTVATCKEESYHTAVVNAAGYIPYVEAALFSDDAMQLELDLSMPYGSHVLHGDGKPKHVVLKLKDTVFGLKYLALGDSYSSGEGDLGSLKNGASFYRAGTDVDGDKARGIPTEKCHVSQRSYPYLLATGMELSSVYEGSLMNWGAIACSGAKIGDINDFESELYTGQNNRLQEFDKEGLKEQALEGLLPGRQKQIEFIKKYRPNVATITAGGNDAGFGSVVRACVSPNVFGGGEWTSECSYAKEDSKKANIAFAIMDLQQELVSLYKDLKNAGNKGMRLYVLGYPTFVNDKPSSLLCGANVRLNRPEREMIVESNKFLNQIIRLAASEAGAMYIDTENSLAGHQLCDTHIRMAVNGITGLLDNAESFHPNHYGHKLMADTVWDSVNGASPLNFTCKDTSLMHCPSYQSALPTIPAYFNKAITQQVRTRMMPLSIPYIIKKGASIPLTILDYTLGSNHISFILMYSDRTEIGSFTTNANGGYAGAIELPKSIAPGYHTVEIESIDQSGEPIKLWKIVEVRSEDANDWDGDGIVNDDDQCLYIQPAGVDRDNDGIDDGCDPELGDYAVSASNNVAINQYLGSIPSAEYDTKNMGMDQASAIDWQDVDQKTNLFKIKNSSMFDKDHNGGESTQINSVATIGVMFLLGMLLWIKIKRKDN